MYKWNLSKKIARYTRKTAFFHSNTVFNDMAVFNPKHFKQKNKRLFLFFYTIRQYRVLRLTHYVGRRWKFVSELTAGVPLIKYFLAVVGPLLKRVSYDLNWKNKKQKLGFVLILLKALRERTWKLQQKAFSV